ncbi:hypothetical protein CPT_Sonora_034 [Stenotrophomonas phage Sonora]|nr:hypothetical protein CPT_Sonora_034 [Stenotrophomonas phage Sonora]
MNDLSDNNEYLQFTGPAAAEGELARLTALAEDQARAEAEVARLEAELGKARDRLRDVAERQVPELMDGIGIESFKTSTGLKIEIAETIRASISVANAPRAFAWLREHGHAALIKRGISLAFGKGQDEKADLLVKELEEKGLDVEDKTSVHPSTLASFVRENLRDGKEIPLDLLGVHRQRVSKIKS